MLGIGRDRRGGVRFPLALPNRSLFLLTFLEGALLIGPHLADAPSSAPTTRRFSALSGDLAEPIGGLRFEIAEHACETTFKAVLARSEIGATE
ncbi:MAG: hypothetical protein WA304_00400 [Candidatus Cybelea sp.]